jgi:hypothetical protein
MGREELCVDQSARDTKKTSGLRQDVTTEHATIIVAQAIHGRSESYLSRLSA